MILVAVREDDRPDLVGVIPQVAEVREDEVDAEVLVPREGEPGIDDDDRAVALVDGHVLPDLAEAPEGDDPAAVSHGPSLRRRLGGAVERPGGSAGRPSHPQLRTN